MNEDIDALLAQSEEDIRAAEDLRSLDALRIQLLGRKGTVTMLLRQLGQMHPDARKAFGERINQAKQKLADALDSRAKQLHEARLQQRLTAERIDVTLPARGESTGGAHPVTRVIRRIEQIFSDMGFETTEGPEVEDDWHNFEALNIPDAHPARAMQDTFYVLNGARLLRTHTSPVQIREMQARQPPIRIICPGRVYRVDFDRTHSPMFHQIEGLYVAENVSLANLKHDLNTFLSQFFEREVDAAFRPSYFPFVEPGAEVHIPWDDPVRGRQWLEVLGCGMVHPNVLKAVGIDPERYGGYAFGLGVERFAMLRYGVNDLRLFFENDQRFLEQFV